MSKVRGWSQAGNARPLGSTQFANALPPSTDKTGKCPSGAQGEGGWVQLELTDT